MKLVSATAAAAALLFGQTAIAQEIQAPEGYQAVSSLVELPDFLPGMGSLYVKPETLPAGPFLAYDRDGKLVSTIYMVPIEDIQAQKPFDNLAVGAGNVVETQLYYNAGHPGVETPHYHVVLWHVPPAEAKLDAAQ